MQLKLLALLPSKGCVRKASLDSQQETHTDRGIKMDLFSSSSDSEGPFKTHSEIAAHSFELPLHTAAQSPDQPEATAVGTQAHMARSPSLECGKVRAQHLRGLLMAALLCNVQGRLALWSSAAEIEWSCGWTAS